jgi:hypothetical protein
LVNTPTYYDTATITAEKGLITMVPGASVTTKKSFTKFVPPLINFHEPSSDKRMTGEVESRFKFPPNFGLKTS